MRYSALDKFLLRNLKKELPRQSLTPRFPQSGSQFFFVGGVTEITTSMTHGVRLWRSTNQDGFSAWQSVSFDGENFDTDGYHDPAINPTRITIPAGRAGVYFVFGYCQFSNIGWTIQPEIRILRNGSNAIARTCDRSNDSPALSIASAYDLAVGDYLELQVYLNTGAAGRVTAVTDAPCFGAILFA